MSMLKTLLIFVLCLTLAGAAVFTRPSEANFKDYLTGARPRTAPSVTPSTPFDRPMTDSEAEQFAAACTFNDRILWVDVSRDGQTLYTGAFAHWFGRPGAGAVHRRDAEAAEKNKSLAHEGARKGHE